MMTTSRLVLCLLISISAYTYAYASANPSAGQEKSAVCQGCHGPDGNSFSPEWPNLASQNTVYLVKQIQDFQSGARKDPTMSQMVVGLTQKDIADITGYFSRQSVNADVTANSAAGKKLYEGGNRYSRTPACASCHGPNGVGNGPGGIPRIAGQKSGYIAKALRDFRSGIRTNDRGDMMQAIAAKLTDKEIDAVAAFMAGMGSKHSAEAKK
jgi:cytochrome c553